MKIDDVINANLMHTADINKNSGITKDNIEEHKELKEASQEFAAVLYEKMLGRMSEAMLAEKGTEEGIWWDYMLRETAGEIAKSPSSPLAVQIYNQLKK